MKPRNKPANGPSGRSQRGPERGPWTSDPTWELRGSPPDNVGIRLIPRKRPKTPRKALSRPIKAPARQGADHCGVSRGEITSWEHCECFACLTKQMRELDRLREKARRREGIKP